MRFVVYGMSAVVLLMYVALVGLLIHVGISAYDRGANGLAADLGSMVKSFNDARQ